MRRHLLSTSTGTGLIIASAGEAIGLCLEREPPLLATLGKNPLPFPPHLAAALGAGPAAAQALSLVLEAVNLGKRDTAIGAKTPWLEQVEGKNRHDRHDAADDASNEGGNCVWS